MHAPVWAFIVTTSYLASLVPAVQQEEAVDTQNSSDIVVEPERPAPVPAEEWSEQTKLDLAQCLVGETDWGRSTEKAILSHILAKRWRLTGGSMTFRRMVHRYCAVLKVRDPSYRQRYVRALPWGELTQDPGFEPDVDWRNYVTPWRHVREFVEKFARGEVPDPMPEAIHWGSVEDGAHIVGAVMLPRTVASIEDGEPVQLVNCIYKVDRDAARRVRQHRMTPHTGQPIPAAIARGNSRRRASRP